MVDLCDLQKQILQNKKDKGFNTTNIPEEFCRAYGELGEAYDAYKKHKPDLGEELADVAIFLLGISEILDINLEEEIINKMQKNKNRVYVEKDGVRYKVNEHE